MVTEYLEAPRHYKGRQESSAGQKEVFISEEQLLNGMMGVKELEGY